MAENNNRESFVESIKVYEINDREKENFYRSFTESQRPNFEAYINYLNAELCVLKRYRIVSDFTRFSARIKSVESAINNDDKKDKTLNDVFGLEIDTATAGEAEFVFQLFKTGLAQTRDKVHNKVKKKYVARHYSGYPKTGNIVERLKEVLETKYDAEEEYKKYIKGLPEYKKAELTDQDKENLKEYFKNSCENLNDYIKTIKSMVKNKKMTSLEEDLKKFETEYYKTIKIDEPTYDKDKQPVIECQFKTIATAIEANLGLAKHSSYKGEDVSEIQTEYDKKGSISLSRLPVMYISYLQRDTNGKPIPPKLASTRHTAAMMYPSLILGPYGGDQK